MNFKIITEMEYKDNLKRLTCTQCGTVKEQYSALVYSQGDLVCTDCKKINEPSDKRAYDRWATSR